jgi:hypothetical protein
MNNSLNYMESVRKGLETAAAENKEAVKCEKKTVATSAGDIATLAKQNFCCDQGSGKPQDQGPLMRTLSKEESADNGMKEFYLAAFGYKAEGSTPEQQLQLCQKMVQGSSKEKSDCLVNAMEKILKVFALLPQAGWSVLKSVFDMDTYMFMINLVDPTDDTARKKVASAVSEIGEGLAARVASITECLGAPYKERYTCELVGETMAFFLGPGMIGKFAKMLAGTSTVGKIGELLTMAATKPPLKQAISAGKVTGKAFGNVIFKPVGKAAGKLAGAQELRKSKPLCEHVS